MVSFFVGSLALSNGPLPPRSAAAARLAVQSLSDTPAVGRRAATFGGLAAILGSPLSALAAATEGKKGILEQESNTAVSANYYFPMAKYRYLPRIFRSWVAVDELAPTALAEGDWEGLQEVWRRLDDSTTAMPLYANNAEGGARGTKKSKRSPTQKKMLAETDAYAEAVKELEGAVGKKNKDRTAKALAKVKTHLGEYRVLASIDGPDGGCIQIPLGNAEEAGHGGVPLGYVVPAFRGGGISNDFSLRPGVPMLKNGQVVQEYKDKI